MTKLIDVMLKTSIITSAAMIIGACGQKGPLIVDRPPTEKVEPQSTVIDTVDEQTETGTTAIEEETQADREPVQAE